METEPLTPDSQEVLDVETAEESQELPHVDLVSTQMPNGLEMFIAYQDDTPLHVLNQHPDLSVFYVLGTEKNKSKAVLFRVTNSLLGWAVSAFKDGIDAPMGLAPVIELGCYKMPPIPDELVDKVDTFFRAVEAKYKTEAIVLLSWDPQTKEWGVLIPEQANTSGHCKYEQESIVDDKPDHVMIVGSIHSHPGMPAYASSTDTHDQADFDGVHITFGYPHGKGLEFHAEMQMGGESFNLANDAVFETMEEKDPFPELEQWMSKVKKANPTVGHQRTLPGAQTHTMITKGGGTPSSGSSSTGQAKKLTPEQAAAAQEAAEHFRGRNATLVRLANRDNRVVGCPNPLKHTIVVHLQTTEKFCPVCDEKLDTMSAPQRRCVHCSTYFLTSAVENLQDLVNIRKKNQVDVRDIDTDSIESVPALPILRWNRTFAPYDVNADKDRKQVVSSSCEVLYKPEHLKEADLPFLD